MVAFFLYIWFCASSQHSIFDEVIEQDEHGDADREADMAREKFTMTETLVALLISLVCVALLLIFLVEEIEHVVASGVPDQFLGLILLPLVEKAAEHLTAIDEAWGEFASTTRKVLCVADNGTFVHHATQTVSSTSRYTIALAHPSRQPCSTALLWWSSGGLWASRWTLTSRSL